MKAFLDDDFLLTTPTARRLYQVARSMPILDYHCHLDPKEIAQDRRFENITQVWLGGDHYKWRLMRANGVDEAYITGDAPDMIAHIASSQIYNYRDGSKSCFVLAIACQIAFAT